jgi:lipoprotein-anchoring transpeptidase ErfK/SrfK
MFSHRAFVLVLMMILLCGVSLSAQTAKRPPRVSMLEAETLLSNLGYWILTVDGRSDASTQHAIMAFQKVEGRKRTGVLSAADMNALRAAKRPEPRYTDPKPHIEVDLTRQVLFVVDDAATVTRILPVSTGNDKTYFEEGKVRLAYTPRGLFQVERKINGVRKASLGDLYYPMYFSSGVAIHGSNSIPRYAASHGCVRIPRFADRALFNLIKVGTDVYVYD